MSPPSVWKVTGRTRMTSRTIETSIGWSAPLRMILSRVLVLIGPFILFTACSRVSPCTASSSIWVIRSPDRMPAFAAGVSSIGATTLTRPSSIVTSMPSPPNSPWVVSCMSRQALLVHVARMRIERGDHAVDRRLDQLGVVGLFDVVGPDPLEHLAEQIELRIGMSAPAAALAAAIQS